MRVAIYTRISTDEERQPFSLEAQETKLRAYITSQDEWHLVGDPYVDQASGATLERHQLKKALAAAKAGRFDVLLVYRVDRLARSIRGLAQVLEELDQAGVVFRSATEPFDTSTPAGRMLVQMLGVFAEFERATIIDRVINGMERKAARGEWCNGHRPYGYVVDKATGHLMVNETEAPVVGRIFDLYVRKHLGAKAIGVLLAKRGLRTRYGKPWNHKAVLTILRNRVYLGEIFFRNTWHVSPDPDRPFHRPLIDPGIFEAAQQLLHARGEASSKQAMTASDYWLSSLISCAHCDKSYLGAVAHGRNRRYRYYVCFSRHRYGSDTCAAERLPAEQLEAGILDALLATYEDSTLIDRAVAAASSRTNQLNEHHRAELATIEHKIQKAEDGIERYLRAFEAKTLPEDTCGERVRALAAELTALRERQTELRHTLAQDPRPPAPQAIATLRERIREAVHTGDDREKKALIQALTHEIKVTGRHKVKPIFYLFGDDDADRVRPLSRSVGPVGFEPTLSRS